MTRIVSERFRREASIVSSLNHPHICTLYDVGVQDGIHYLVMEHIDGETLQGRLERGPLPLAPRARIRDPDFDALDKAHRRGIIHRDLKPANVMLAKSGVKLLDFGLAKIERAPAPAPDAHTRTLTSEGTILGTFQYMAPEQVEGKDADARTDIFAFGALVYEMITAKKAFDGPTQAQRDRRDPERRTSADHRDRARRAAVPRSRRLPDASRKIPTTDGRRRTTCCSSCGRSPLRRRLASADRECSHVGSSVRCGWRSSSPRLPVPVSGRRAAMSVPARRRANAPAIGYTLFPADGVSVYSVHGPSVGAVPGRPLHRLRGRQGRRTDATVASLAVPRSANRHCRAPKGRTHHSGRPTASGLDSPPQTV